MGKPYPGHRVAAIDDDGNEVQAGQIGDTRHKSVIGVMVNPIRCFSSATGKHDEATLANSSGDWCRTGDLARLDADGYLGGIRDALMTCSSARAIGSDRLNRKLPRQASGSGQCRGPCRVRTAERGNIVKAFIVLTAGYTSSKDLAVEIQEHVRGKLAPYEYPKEIEFVDALPMTTTGESAAAGAAPCRKWSVKSIAAKQ
jgi:acetyl-CoA synthetase